MRRWSEILFAIAGILTTGCTVMGSESLSRSDSGTLYNVYEQSFTCTNCSSQTDADKTSQLFTVTFTNGSTSSLTLPGFWAGGDIWRFRFAPTSVGLWNWTIHSPGRTFAEAPTGSLNVGPSDNRGFLRPNPDKPYSFSYSDGTPEFVWGNTAYKILDTALEGTKEPNGRLRWQYFIDQTKAHGMTKIRLLVTMWDFGHVYGADRYPWKNCTPAHPSFDLFNQTYWEKLDEIVRYMQTQGVIAELILFPDYSVSPDRSTPNGIKPTPSPGLYAMTQAQEQLYLRFAIARYAGYSNVIWCLTNEWGASSRSRFCEKSYPPGNNPNSGNCLWHPEWISGGPISSNGCRNIGSEFGLGPFLRTHDPYIAANGRLLSAHQKGTKGENGKLVPNYVFDFWKDAWPTHGIFQMANYDPARSKGHDWGNYGIIANWGHNKPVFNDEYGYDDGRNITRELARKAAWGIAVAGGYGTYGDWHKAGRLNVECSLAGLWEPHSSQEDIQVLIHLMKGVDYNGMSQHNELVTASSPAYLYASPGKQYVMYAADGGSNSTFLVDLPQGKYEARWYSTANGSVSKSEPPFEWSGGKKPFQPPSDFSKNTDTVLKISAVRDPTEAASP